MDFSDPNFSFETYQKAKLGLSIVPGTIHNAILNSTHSNTRLCLEYLNQTKNIYYVENFDETDLIIAATKDIPKFTSTFLKYTVTAYDIFEHIKFYVHKLLPNKTTLKDYDIKINKYAIIYGNRDFINDNSKTILKSFGITVIPIYSDEFLYFDYINNYINYDFKKNKLNVKLTDRTWKPWLDKNTQKKKYNIIIEKIIKLKFELLHTFKIPKWDYNSIYIDIKRDEELGQYNTKDKNDITKSIEQDVSEDYLYQIWLFYTHILRYNNSLTDIYKKTVNNSDPTLLDVISASDKYNLKGGNLSLEFLNENELNIIISKYSKELSSNQKKYLKQFYEYEKLDLIKTLDILTVIELKKNMDARQRDIIEIYDSDASTPIFMSFNEKSEFGIMVICIIVISIIILSLLILVLRKNIIENYNDD